MKQKDYLHLQMCYSKQKRAHPSHLQANMTQIKILFFFISLSSVINAQTIHITELASKGSADIIDFEGDHSDWIEISNPNSEAINCHAYYLSDNADLPLLFKLPDTIISGESSILVFASGKDTIVDGEIHLNFKLSGNGETVFLTSASENTLQSVPLPSLEFDQSWGTVSHTDTTYKLYDFPTPLKDNGKSNNISFSKQGGVYLETVIVDIISENGDTVYYTLDGSIPTNTSKAVQNYFTFSPQIHNNISQIPTTPLTGNNIEYFIWYEPQNERHTAYTLRCRSFRNGIPTSKTYTQTYLAAPHALELFEFPVFFITGDSVDFFSYKTGIFVPGEYHDLKKETASLPVGNYHRKRYIHTNIEFISTNGNTIINSPTKIRTRGGGSLCYPQKSIKVNFDKDIGGIKPDFDFFGTGEDQEFKTLILRNGGNDFYKTHFSEAFIQSLLSDLNMEVQLSSPAHAFINGEYWGFFNIREPHDKHYFKRKFGIEENELIVVNDCGEKEFGNNVEYHNLIDFISKNPLSNSENYTHVKEKIDMLNCIDYYCMQIFIANKDWPGNNYKMWKTTSSSSKWRWLIYDLDFAWNRFSAVSADKDMFSHATETDGPSWPNPPCSTFLLRKLLESDEFTQAFINRFQFHLENTFEPNRVIAKINRFERLYEGQIQHQTDRWGYPDSKESWYRYIENLRAFAKDRPCNIKEQIISFFALDEFNYACPVVGMEDTRNNHISVFPSVASNTITVTSGSSIEEICLLNNLGKVTHMEHWQDSSFKQSISIKGFASGLYIVRVKTSIGVFSSKVIVE